MEAKTVKYSDIGTPERHARGDLEIRNPDGIQKKIMVKHVSPIHTYYQRKQITSAQFAAGTALYQSYATAWTGYKSYEIQERISGGIVAPTMSEKQLQAIIRYDKGMKAIGKEDAALVFSVVIEEEHLTNRSMGGSARAKLKIQFGKALDRAAKAFNYI